MNKLTDFLESKGYMIFNMRKKICLWIDTETYQPIKYKNSSVFYMNFTPDGTYIWNTKIVKNLNTTTSLMNKSTMNSDYKIDKDVWYLDPKYAKKYDYKYK